MPVVYVVHSDKEEISKVRHILSGRDLLLMEFESVESAIEMLSIKPPDLCLLPIDLQTGDGRSFLDVLHGVVFDCPAILLINKDQISRAVKSIGQDFIFDYFLMHPIVDSVRLHVIVDKALTQSAVQLNLEDLKRRLGSLPSDLPKAFEEQAGNLQRGINRCLNNFKERMKSHEFENIVQMVDEEAFDDKFEAFKNDEILTTIDRNTTEISNDLLNRLTAFTRHIQEQIEDPPRWEDLNELRKKLAGEATPIENLKQDTGRALEKISHGVSVKSRCTVLFVDDEENPSSDLARIIESFGHRVLNAQSPMKAYEMAKSDEIDILVCGHKLGRMDGIELVRRIREGLGRINLPVIMLSTNPTGNVLEQSRDVGISEVIKLPLLPRSLQEKISLHIRD